MSNCRESGQKAQALAQALEVFVTPVLVKLDARLDSRLVRTFLVT